MNTPAIVPRQRAEAWGLPSGAVVWALIWFAPNGAPFLGAWIALSAWLWWRAGASALPRRPWFAVAALTVAPLPLVWEGCPGWLAGTRLAPGAGTVPLHLWIENAMRSLRRAEFALLLVAQPGVALLHRWLDAHPHQLDASSVNALQILFVTSPVAHSGLALVREEQEPVICSVVLSQSAPILA